MLEPKLLRWFLVVLPQFDNVDSMMLVLRVCLLALFALQASASSQVSVLNFLEGPQVLYSTLVFNCLDKPLFRTQEIPPDKYGFSQISGKTNSNYICYYVNIPLSDLLKCVDMRPHDPELYFPPGAARKMSP